MVNAVLVDSGPLYALADPSDQYHQRANAEYALLQNQGLELIVSYSAMLEAYSLIQRNLSLKLAQRWLQELVQNGSLLNPTGEDYLDAAAKVQHYADQEITLFDATLAVLAERLGLPVWTFDADFDIMRVAVWRAGV